MPVMNGLQAAPQLRRLLPSVPITLFTLYAGSVLEKEARAAGITSIVSKGEAASSW
jgi:CheY-like chemotaxis protein